MKKNNSFQPQNYLRDVGKIVHGLTQLGWQPVLIGGMALVVLGSRRVTRDFDFVVAKPGDGMGDVVDLFYSNGFELASKLDAEGNVVSTIDNQTVAKLRCDLDSPSSVYFYNHTTGLKIDLLFDFPISAERLLSKATKNKMDSHTLMIASKQHLLELKRMAQSSRKKPGDAEDILFLERLQKK